MKRTVTASTTATASSSSSSSSESSGVCHECKTRPSRAFLPCGHQPLCLNCADTLLTTASPCCPLCQLRYVDFIAVTLGEPSKLAQMVAGRSSTSASASASAPAPSTGSPAESDLPSHEQLRRSPNFSQARELYSKAMALLGDGASVCSTPVLERPPMVGDIPPKSAEAFKLFVQSAGLGFPFSQFMVAIMLQGGIGCTVNEELSLKWLKKAASADLALAMIQLAQMYNSGKGIYKDLAKMTKLYRRAAATERSFALVAFGYCLLFGHGVEQDFEMAREVLLAAHNAGDKAKALHFLGLIFFNGLGVPVSPKNAFEYFLLAATAGESQSQHWLSRCYSVGLGTKESQTEAAKWAAKAAAAGIPAAQHDLGCRYMNGNGLQEDVALGVSWTEKAADQNHVGAIVSLAYYFSQGQGVQHSDENAETCRALGRELLEDSLHKLEMGECLEFGEGSDRNVDSAKVWYREASSSSVHADFALIRFGEAGKKARKAKKQAPEPADVSKPNTSLTMVRPRSKSAASKPDMAKLAAAASTPAAPVAAEPAPSSTSAAAPAPPAKEKKSKLRRLSAGVASAPNLFKISEDVAREDSAGGSSDKKKLTIKKPKILSIQFKRSASHEAIKSGAGAKRTRFAPLEISTSFAEVALS